MPTTEDTLLAVLERARAVGFLGPGPLRVHLDHAWRYAALVPLGAHLIDLGSGGGLPGLPLLAERQDLTGVLLDAAQKRVSFLVWALTELGLGDRVSAVQARAEEAAHQSGHRERYDVVACRGFGPPAITLECGVGYLRPGGRLLISEPPERRTWLPDGLAVLGLRALDDQPSNGHASNDGGDDDAARVAAFERVGPLAPSVPRSFATMRRSPTPVVS